MMWFKIYLCWLGKQFKGLIMTILFEQTKLSLNGKQGVLTPDEDGYYELVLGALNTYNNTRAWYYTDKGARELFGPGSLIHRKIANGCMRGEVNHPKQMPGEKLEDFYNRMMDIDLNNVCCHFKSIWLDETFGKANPQFNNPDMIAIMGKVKPSGPKGFILKEALDNKHENVCFSIRSLANEEIVRGKRIRALTELITIDFVNEGGILVASKWDTPATESLASTPVVEQVLRRCGSKGNERAFALESAQVADYILSKHFAQPKPQVYHNW